MTIKTDVEFGSEGEHVRGILVRPDTAGPCPIVIMGGGWCYVKEIVMPHYAEALVEAGSAVLMFDYRNFGASDGKRRQHIDPWMQIEDYRNAVSFVYTLENIDTERIGVWGISYAGGHVLIAGAIDPRVKCVISNIPVVNGYENMRRVHGAKRFQDLCDQLLEDRIKRTLEDNEPGHLPMSSDDPWNELSTWPFPRIREVFTNIKESEAPLHEHWSTVESTELLLNYDVEPFLSRLYDTPVLMVVAEGDEITLWDLEIEAFNKIPSPKKEIAVLPKVSHMSLYSEQSDLQSAGGIAADFVRRTFHL